MNKNWFIFYLGSIGGSLNLIISGQGFSSNTQVKICNKSCQVQKSRADSITCLVKLKNLIDIQLNKYKFKISI